MWFQCVDNGEVPLYVCPQYDCGVNGNYLKRLKVTGYIKWVELACVGMKSLLKIQ